MKLLAPLRAKGHRIHLEGLRIVLVLADGADRAAAERWARLHEQALRRELVSEIQRVAGIAVELGAKVRNVRDANGNPIVGGVDVAA